jgi:hypothetical protein
MIKAPPGVFERAMDKNLREGLILEDCGGTLWNGTNPETIMEPNNENTPKRTFSKVENVRHNAFLSLIVQHE